ncbi:hypothetical protein [Streptomyces sp. NPDC093589]|uniref:hypothetical protein n=1 Tax=Streptomyces sp. NPDC093589 TaxID=3366043 RepID=UPI003816E769
MTDTDDRRERYGRALAEDYGDFWDSLTGEEREVWRRAGDAATAVADAEQREQPECSCVRKNPLDYDGPDEDCPQHGNPPVLGYCPLVEWEAWRDENGRLRAELEQERGRVQAITEATVMWRDRPGGDVGLAIALAGILDTERPEPQASTALVRVLAECDRIEREVHSQHDHDATREAVRRIRTAAEHAKEQQ